MLTIFKILQKEEYFPFVSWEKENWNWFPFPLLIELLLLRLLLLLLFEFEFVEDKGVDFESEEVDFLSNWGENETAFLLLLIIII